MIGKDALGWFGHVDIEIDQMLYYSGGRGSETEGTFEEDIVG